MQSKISTDIPMVITLAPADGGDRPKTFDGYEMSDALQRLLDEGAACVGINCSRGPKTIVPLIRHLRKSVQVYQVEIIQSICSRVSRKIDARRDADAVGRYSYKYVYEYHTYDYI